MLRENWIELLLTDVQAFNEHRNANPKEPLDLREANLSGAQLQRAFLADADLQGSTMVGTNLARANLSGANLRDANLQKADLTDSTLHRADLTGADLRGAKVGGLVGDGRMCLHPSCFENVMFDRVQVEAALEVLNKNRAWHIKYELVPKSADGNSTRS